MSPHPAMLGGPCCTCVPVPSHVRQTLLYLCPCTSHVRQTLLYLCPRHCGEALPPPHRRRHLPNWVNVPQGPRVPLRMRTAASKSHDVPYTPMCEAGRAQHVVCRFWTAVHATLNGSIGHWRVIALIRRCFCARTNGGASYDAWSSVACNVVQHSVRDPPPHEGRTHAKDAPQK